ncbi:MAG: amino acid adenylation domain-containing protein, partial [Bacteroidota bacterium]
ASFMAQEWKLKPNDIVAVMTERSVECVIGLLAIMKAGGAFLPMDASSPANRIAAILHDANVSGILTESQFLFSLPESSTQNILALDVQLDEVSGYAENLESNVDQSNLAYVIYTSGSTGKPKGVAIQQKSFANYLNWANAYYFKNQRGNIFGWFTSLAFDLTLTSIFTTLMRGDKLVICPAMENDDLVRFVFSEENDINTIKLTPSHLGLLSYVPVAKTNIKTVIVGGEKLTREQIASLFAIDKNIVLFNEYGPTETTVGCSVNRVSSVDDHESVGRPIEHTGIFILDENQNLLPVGCSGEICVSGDGVSQGYLRQVELTKQKFVDHALVSAGKLYRTGDKGKWTRDGQLIYQGRLDSQVKIRGYRIELQEIETLLLQHHAVEKVAVLAKALSQDELQLVAFYTSASGTEQDLNGYLKKFLPPYMVPSIFRLMKDFPLNRNGKLDAEKLLKEDLGLKVEGFVEPENELQRKLQTIWQNVLRREPIGINEDFFSLGGESLKAIQLVYHIGRDLGMKIKPSDVFTYTTIGTLAEILEAAAQKDHQPLASMAVEEQDHYPVSHAQKRLWYFDRANSANRHAYHIPTIHYFTGNFSAESFKNAVKAVADRHEALRTVFVQIDDVPRQKIIEPAHFEVPVNIVDLSNHSDKDTAFEAIKRAVENKPFDLRFDALFRMCVVKIDDGDFRVLAAIHHIISDEWSFELLGREIISRYNAIESKEDLVYEKLRVHYKDFAVWQNYTIHGDTGTEVNGRDEHKHYWLNKFASPPALIDLPFAKLRPQVKTFSGQRVNFTLEKQVVDDLKIYCSRSGVSLFMLLFGALKVLIYRYTRETDLVLSTPTVGRDHVDLENMMGNFVNMLAIRTSVNGDHNFETYLRQVKSAMLEAYDHQLYPFDCLLEELHLETDFSRQPLFD